MMNTFKDKWEHLCEEGIEKEENRDKVFSIDPVSPEMFFSEWLKPQLSEEQLKAVNSIFKETKDGIEWNREFQEYLLFWGEGSGKDFLCSRVLVYCAYWLMCLNNPQKYFGIADKESIDLVNVSVSSTHARDVFFYKFTTALKSVKNPKTGSNWFTEQGMDLRDKQDIQTSTVKFKKNIRAHSKHSEKYAGEGLNVLMAVFDEVGEFSPKKAKALYESLWHTETSRYGNKFKMFLISYMRDPHDFMSYRWEKTKENNDGVYRSKKSTWEVNPLKTRKDFDKAYEKDPEGSAMRYENKNTRGSSSRFFKFQERIRDNITERDTPFVGNPKYTGNLLEETLHSWFKPSTTQGLEKLRESEAMGELTEQEKRIKEKLILQHQDAKYYIHIDLAKANSALKNDCAGFAMGHAYKLSPEDEEEESETGVYTDLLIQLRVNEGELDFEMIRKFIYKLVEMGFNIAKVTLDGYQSVDFQQRLRAKGIETETLSIDRSLEPYNTLKEQLYTKRLNYYEYMVLTRELEEVVLEDGKVDHPATSSRRSLEEGMDKGSKDVADALAGVVYSSLDAEPEKPAWFTM